MPGWQPEKGVTEQSPPAQLPWHWHTPSCTRKHVVCCLPVATGHTDRELGGIKHINLNLNIGEYS